MTSTVYSITHYRIHYWHISCPSFGLRFVPPDRVNEFFADRPVLWDENEPVFVGTD